MNREWLPIIWILVGIFLLIALISTWNRRESGRRRQQAGREREAVCARLVKEMSGYRVSLDEPACRRLMAGVPASRMPAYRSCLESGDFAFCTVSLLCRDVREPACSWLAVLSWDRPGARPRAFEDLTRLCTRENSREACMQLVRLAPESAAVWQSHLCRLAGQECNFTGNAVLARCLANPLLPACRKPAEADPVSLFLACEALSGAACRAWAHALFPHTRDTGDAYWSPERLGYLCTLGDAGSCAQLGVRLRRPGLLALSCRKGNAAACQDLAGMERTPVRADFLRWMAQHPAVF